MSSSLPATPPTANAPDEHDFGDPFDITRLPLPRPARGYAVQRLGTDCVLDNRHGELLPVRSAGLDALFDSHAAATRAARQWLSSHPAQADAELAIVPASYDDILQRPILIFGMLCAHP